VVERAIANFKTWRCMFTDYRRPLRTYKTAFHTVRDPTDDAGDGDRNGSAGRTRSGR
jgi:hypothetical protein